jgi:hypothetical protein
MKKILIAIRPEDMQLMSDALGSDFDTVACFSLDEAKTALDHNISLVICGLHFDDGRMFDFLKHAKAGAATASIPFFCVKGAGGPLSRAIYQGIVIATEALGATGFVDLSDLRNKLGDEQTYKVLRDALLQILSAPAASAN